jgi:hypothetical protein
MIGIVIRYQPVLAQLLRKKLRKAISHKVGDYFEFYAIVHNESEIKSGDDISPDFRCKKCGATKEVDHITRDENGNITKVVQCKSDHSKVAGGDSEKGVIIKPKQLKEDRKLVAAINESQKNSGVLAQLEYKLEAGEAAEDAKIFLMKKNPPIVTFIIT